MVLRRVEHLEQRRRRVAAPVGADLVDLVEQDHRVHRAGVAQGAHEPPGQGADVGAAMAADLGLVAHAAQRHAHELAARGPGDRLADRGLAGARRPDQRQDGARALVLGDAAILPQLAHGQVLGDAVLDVLEAGVVGVQHLARVHRIEPLLGALRPRHREQPVEVGPDHRRLAAMARPSARAAPARARPARARPRACRPPRSCCGTRRRPSRRPRRAPCGSRPSACAGSTRAAASAAPDSTSSRMRCADLQLGQPLALELAAPAQPLDDVERLEQLAASARS